MNEKVKNRGWVKNAAIIFLLAMLVLTFFSNTIMNRSLPEVATANIIPGTISSKIRGSGTIEAAESYQIKTRDSRKIQSVLVKLEQEVKVGDTLIILGAGDSAELSSAKEAVANAEYAYNQKLISVSMQSNELQIIRAKEKLENAIKQQERTKVNPADITTAEARLSIANEKLRNGMPGAPSIAELETAAEKMNNKSNELEQKKAQDSVKYEALIYIANQKHEQAKNDSSPDPDMVGATEEQWQAFVAKGFGGAVADAALGPLLGKPMPPDVDDSVVEYNIDGNPLKLKYYGAFVFLKKEIADSFVEIEILKDELNTLTEEYELLDKKYKTINAALILEQEKAQAAYNAIMERKNIYEVARDEAVQAQVALEQLLSNKKLDNLDLQNLRRSLGEAQARLAKLMADVGPGGEIKSEVNGVIKQINVSAGDTSEPGLPLLVIEVPDRGYNATITVTREQASKLKIGANAEVFAGYWGWGEKIKARLIAILPDKENPQGNKKLLFELSGENIESGTQVNISVSEETKQYESTVPNAAIRTDSNGTFVYVVEVKNSPLGNRYVATRVDVQVLAKDDAMSAISGALPSWGYVITSSSKPIEAGNLVKLAD